MHSWLYALTPFGAWLLDFLVGDPRSQWHPVVLIGKLISFWEAIFYPKKDAGYRLMIWRGLCLVLGTLATTGIIGWLILFILLEINYYIYLLGVIFILYITITPNALARDANEIMNLLIRNNLPLAREKLSWIVGRDTENLHEEDIARATIETVAENITDGIISPLFYFLLFGPLGALLYRATNTMDSMVAYKSERYLYFGRIAAKWDDVLNYIPARLTMLLILLASYVLHLDVKSAWRIVRRDANKHPSPNGGFAEATVAGALGIRLGGYNFYGGKKEFRAYMGDPIYTISRYHIAKTVRLMYISTFWAVLVVSAILLLVR